MQVEYASPELCFDPIWLHWHFQCGHILSITRVHIHVGGIDSIFSISSMAQTVMKYPMGCGMCVWVYMFVCLCKTPHCLGSTHSTILYRILPLITKDVLHGLADWVELPDQIYAELSVQKSSSAWS